MVALDVGDDVAAPPSSIVDFDVHGIVGVRVIAESARDRALVERELRGFRRPLEREPDVVVEFVDHLPTPSLRYLGLRDAAFSDDGFFVLRRRGRTQAKVRIPLERLGERCTIVCETGIGSVPLLAQIVGLAALPKGVVAVHGTAFVHRSVGVLVVGWAKGGKTETLLGFMRMGARYVGDETVFVDAQHGRLYGLRRPIKVWDWHLDGLDDVRTRFARTQRAKIRAATLAQSLVARAPSGQARRGEALLERQRFADAAPEQLFGAESCDLTGSLDRLVLTVSHAADRVAAEPVDARSVVERTVVSNAYERLDLLAAALQYRFAFPQATVALVEEAEERERALLAGLSDTPAYVLSHPFPAPIPTLYEVLQGAIHAA